MMQYHNVSGCTKNIQWLSNFLFEILEMGPRMKGAKESALERDVYFRWPLAEPQHHGYRWWSSYYVSDTGLSALTATDLKDNFTVSDTLPRALTHEHAHSEGSLTRSKLQFSWDAWLIQQPYFEVLSGFGRRSSQTFVQVITSCWASFFLPSRSSGRLW